VTISTALAASVLAAVALLRIPTFIRVCKRVMANTKSARKATRKIARRTVINQARRSRSRTAVRAVEEAITAGDRNKAAEAMKHAEPQLMKAAQTGQIHRNAASRKISRLTKSIAKLGK